MPLTWRERLALRLRVRYKIKRIYLTLGVPIIIAAIIFGLAIYAGIAAFPNLSAVGSTSPQASAAEQRLLEIQKILGNNSISSTSPIPLSTLVVNPHNFDYLLVGVLGVALAPYAIDTYRTERRRRKYEVDFADFLFEMSELIRGGIDPVKAVNTLAEGDLGSITKQVKIAAKQMQIGSTFEQAMRNLSTSLNSSLITRYVDLVIQASYSGGGVSNLIQRASADMSTFISLEGQKRAGLAQYTMILYVGQAVLIALSAIIVIQFVPELSSISAIGSTSLAGSFLSNSDITTVPLERDLFLLCILNGFLGGLVIGKISEGKIKHGIKHSLILVLIAFIAWTAFVVPASSSVGPQYPFAVVSYDKSGPAGVPLPDSVVVQVNMTNGAPAVSVTVTFGIAGPGGSVGAQVVPTYVTTDANGLARATVILGSSAGLYTVSITVGGNTTAIEITATGNGLAA
jgi:flagellar protein FlaJ